MGPWRTTFLTNSIISLLGLFSGVLVARVLGVNDRGALMALLYWPHFLAGIAALGLNEGIVIRTARNGSSKTLRATTLALSISLAVVGAVAGWVIMPILISGERADNIFFSQVYMVAFLPLTFIAQNFLAIDQGESNFRHFNQQRIIQSAFYPLLLAIFWYIGVLNVQSAVVAVLSGTAVVAFLRVWNARLGLKIFPSLNEAKEIFSISYPLHLVNLVMFFSQQADRMMLVSLGSAYDLGLYVVAFTAASTVGSIIIQTYINIMLPMAARLGSSASRIKEIVNPLRRLIGVVFLSTAGIFILMPILVELVFGGEYKLSGNYAQILLVAFAFMGIKKAFVYILRSWSENRAAIISEGLTVVILIPGSYISLRWGGVTELCLVVVMAHAAGLVVVGFRFLRLSDITLRQLFSLNPIPLSKDSNS